MMKFEIRKAENGQFFFSIKASNGQIICTSETFESKLSAKEAIDSIKQNAAFASIADMP